MMNSVVDEIRVDEHLCIKVKYIVDDRGMIYIPDLVSDGASGLQCIENLIHLGVVASVSMRSIFLSEAYKPSPVDTVHNAVIMRGAVINIMKRSTGKIREMAKELKFLCPSPELVYLIAKKFNEEDLKGMGLQSIRVMHELFKDEYGDWSGFEVTYGDNGAYISSHYDSEGELTWAHHVGFAFSCGQVPAMC